MAERPVTEEPWFQRAYDDYDFPDDYDEDDGEPDELDDYARSVLDGTYEPEPKQRP